MCINKLTSISEECTPMRYGIGALNTVTYFTNDVILNKNLAITNRSRVNTIC